MSCLSCHRIGTDGPEHPLGPDLSVIGRAMTPEMIVESVLWPKRQVKEGFLLTEITMKDGTQWSGFKASETRTDLNLRGVDGVETRLTKSEIKQRTDAGTIMPDGLTDTLTRQQRLDLLRYLITLGK
jgi:putative heme-binding domain-containing protein